jgi:hypothetical protein
VVFKNVMGSLSKHADKGLCARVFDGLRLTGPPSLIKIEYAMGRNEGSSSLY